MPKVDTSHNEWVFGKQGVFNKHSLAGGARVPGDICCRLYQGHCVKIMEKVIGLPMVDLVFADPPFNINYEYDVYKDNRDAANYRGWVSDWLIACHDIMKPNASIYVAIGLQFQAQMKLLMDNVGFKWRNTICWHYTFGPNQSTNWTPSWVAIHYATKSHKGDFTWNPEAVAVPSARQLKYNDKRANPKGKTPDNTWILLPGESNECFTPGQNAMLESRVCGTFKERTNHPCQMPIPLLERIIKASSNPNDLVFDPFMGSGTTAVAAIRNKRRCYGVELSRNYIEECAVPRIKEELANVYQKT